MFTGIVTAQGEITAIERRNGLIRWTVESTYDAAGVAIGASILHAGCCLTVVEIQGLGPAQMRHVVEIAAESIGVTTLAHYQVGDRVNLERSLAIGDELGGHIVSGHVDGLGEVQSVSADGEGWRVTIKAPAHVAPLVAPKGSIAVDGVSLTVNEVDGDVFGVLIIPHTWAVTSLCALKPGARVNLEADMLARYVARILSYQTDARSAAR
jgi:riboflavin synthase